MRTPRTYAALSSVALLAGLAMAAPGTAAAAESPETQQRGDQSQSARASAASCVFIENQEVKGYGNHVNFYFQQNAWVRNNCTTPQYVTLDAQWYPDPPCETIQPGTTQRLDYTYDASLPPGVGDLRGVVAC